MTNLIEIQQLKKYFPIYRGVLLRRHVGDVRAVDGVDLSIQQSSTLGLVGESGCGKSTLGRCILRLIEPTEGKIIFDGRDITFLKSHELRDLRRDMQIVFQDPQASLNPRMTAGRIIGEPLDVFKLGDKSGRHEKLNELMEMVGLDPAMASRYPHEFSGGQKQRIGVARALALNPKFIVCDEPVSALDVSIQAQIVNLMQELQEKLNLTFLFIAHDLSVVRHISDWIAVMYLGRVVEHAPTEMFFANPCHPYTQVLLKSIPIPDPNAPAEYAPLKGDPPSPAAPPSGCRFHTRCPKRFEPCDKIPPVPVLIENNHTVECHLYSGANKS
jgi:oligopeptide/dipeptide ABC transporter ATP-binding protein